MSRKNKLRIQIALFSLIISSVFTILVSFFIKEYDLSKLLIYSIVFTFLAAVIIYLSLSFFVKFFLNKRIKEISDQLFNQDLNLNKTITTDMDDLIDQIKQFDDERKIELSEMREQETFRREFHRASGSSMNSGIDFFDRGIACSFKSQIHTGHIWRGYANSHAIQFAV